MTAGERSVSSLAPRASTVSVNRPGSCHALPSIHPRNVGKLVLFRPYWSVSHQPSPPKPAVSPANRMIWRLAQQLHGVFNNSHGASAKSLVLARFTHALPGPSSLSNAMTDNTLL